MPHDDVPSSSRSEDLISKSTPPDLFFFFFLFIFKLVVFSLHQSPIFHAHDSLWSHKKKASCHLFQIYSRTPERSGLKLYHAAFPTRGLYVGGLPRYILAVYTLISLSVLFNHTCFAERERIWCYITPVNALIGDATSPIYFTPTHAVVLFKLVRAPGCCYVILCKIIKSFACLWY